MAFFDRFRKKEETPPPPPPPAAPPKLCTRCQRPKAPADFPDPVAPDTCRTCLTIPAGEPLRTCPQCEEPRAASDFASQVQPSDIAPTAAVDERQRREAIGFLLAVCRHCKQQCSVCKVIYPAPHLQRLDPTVSTPGIFPNFPDPVCFMHYRQCQRCTESKQIAKHFTLWQHVCDGCLKRAFPEPGMPALLLALAKLAKFGDYAEPAPTSMAAAMKAPPGTAFIGTDEVGGVTMLPLTVRNRHVYIIGRTGSGKTLTLKNLIRQDMTAGAGIGFLDPHGDAAFDLLGHVPEHRRGDVVYFCPTDTDCPTFNLLAAPYEPAKLTGDIVSALKLFFGDSWGFRMEQILTMALLTLIADKPNQIHTFADLKRLLVLDDYRDEITARVTNQQLADFWRYEFPKFPKDATAPITNKLAQFLMPLSPMERIFSQPRNDLDPFTLMNEGKILLCNLSKGQLGESAAFLIGALLTTALSQAALARVSIPERERRDFFWYVDEFQNFAVSSFSSILSEARKYRLNLTLAHQYLDQVDSKLYSAIIGNVAAVICLPVSPNDANTMAQLMGTTRHVQADGTLYDLNDSVVQTGRRWMIALSHLAMIDPTGNDKAQIAELQPALVDEHLRLLTPDIVRRFIPGGDTRSGEPEFPPANFKENPRFRWVFREHILQRFGEFVEDPHTLALVPDGLRQVRWPSPQDFLTLDPLHGFVRIDNASNVRRFSFSPPTDQPSASVRAAVLEEQRQRLQRATVPDQPRPHLPQDERKPPEPTLPLHQNSTTFDDSGSEPVHSEHADDPRPKLKQFPKPPRPA